MNLDTVISDRSTWFPRRPVHPLAEVDEPSAARPGAASSAGVRAPWRRPSAARCCYPEIDSYHWIIIAIVVGTVARRAAGHGAADGRAAADRALARLRRPGRRPGRHRRVLSCRLPERRRSPRFAPARSWPRCILGFLTFTGSLMAAGKLMEIIPTRPITYHGQNVVNLVAARRRRPGRRPAWRSIPTQWPLFPIIILLSLAFGVLLIIPIGGADMPTVISLLNSYAGLSAVAMGFVLEQQAADRRRRARRLVGPDPVDHHVQGDEPLVHQRAVRRLRPGAGHGRRGRAAHGTRAPRPRTRRRSSSSRQPRGHRARLRHGGGPGPAPRPRAVRRAHQARRRREVRHPPGGRPHARPHERAAGRGRDPLRPADRDGRRSTPRCRRPTWRWWSAPTTW